jgi:hypothetical protein
MGLFGTKQKGLECDRTASSRAEVKNAWNYIINPPYMFIARSLNMNNDKLYNTRRIYGEN